MREKLLAVLLILLSVSFYSCGDSTTAPVTELLLSSDGLLEQLGGDCSAVQIRTRSLGTTDLQPFSKLRIEVDGSSDADLSSIQIYYISETEQINLLDLRNREEINNVKSFEVASPKIQGELYSRVTLKSSVCTGQIYFLTLRDIKIFGIR